MARKVSTEKRLLKIIKGLSLYDSCRFCEDNLDELEKQIKELELDAYNKKIHTLTGIQISLNKHGSNSWEWHIDVKKRSD